MLAQTMQQGSGEKQKEASTTGLEFMSWRFNVAYTIFELMVTKQITQSERSLIDLIQFGTIGAQNERRQFCTKAEFYLDDLSKALKYKKKDKIWSLLKSLHAKGIITREPTRSKNKELIGLNPEKIGQILSNTLHSEETKRHLKLAVDNSKKEPTPCSQITDTSSVIDMHSAGGLPASRGQSDSQHIGIIDEKPLLDSSRLILDSSRRETGERFTHFREPEAESESLKKTRQESMAKIAKSLGAWGKMA